MFPEQPDSQPTAKKINQLKSQLTALEKQLAELEEAEIANKKLKEKEYSDEYFQKKQEKIREDIRVIKAHLRKIKLQEEEEREEEKEELKPAVFEPASRQVCDKVNEVSLVENNPSSGFRLAASFSSRQQSHISKFFENKLQLPATSANVAITPQQKKEEQKFRIVAKKYKNLFERLHVTSDKQFFTTLENILKAIAQKKDDRAKRDLFEYYNIHNTIPPLLIKGDYMLFTLVGAACSRLQINIVTALIENGTSVNVPNNRYASPISLAALALNEELIDILIEAGANVNFKDARGGTALHYAIDSAEVKKDKNGPGKMLGVVKKLLSIPGIDTNAIGNKPFNEISPLINALKMNYMAVCILLIQKGADINLIDNYGKTALHYLFSEAFKKRIDLSLQRTTIINYLKIFIQNGARIDRINEDISVTVADLIANLRDIELYKLFIDNADLNIKIQRDNRCYLLRILAERGMVLKTKDSKIYLHFHEGNYEIAIERLTQHEKNKLLGISVLKLDDFPEEYINIAKYLLENGADPKFISNLSDLDWSNEKNESYINMSTVSKGIETCQIDVSLLCYTCMREHKQLVKIFLANGADSNQNIGTLSPLFIAIFVASSSKNNAIIQLLLEYQADVNHLGPTHAPFDCNEHGVTPLIFSAIYDSLEAVNVLLNIKTIDVNFFSKKYGSALHVAAKYNLITIAQALLAAGADPMLEENNLSSSGEKNEPLMATPLMLAIKYNHEEMAILLLANFNGNPRSVFAFLIEYRATISLLDAVLNKYFNYINTASYIYILESRINDLGYLLVSFYSNNLNDHLDCVLKHINNQFEEIIPNCLYILINYLYFKNDSEKASKLIDQYALNPVEMPLIDRINLTIRDWLEGRSGPCSFSFEDSIEPTQDDKQKRSQLSTTSTSVNNNSDRPIYENTTGNTNSMSGRQFLRSIGFNDTEINKMVEQNKKKTSAMKMGEKTKSKATFFSEHSGNKSQSESGWFNNLLTDKNVIPLDNSKPPRFLWIPNGLFTQEIEKIFNAKRYKLGNYNFKFINDPKLNNVIRSVTIGNESYELNFCGELKDYQSERRLLIFQHKDLLIALDYLDHGLHTKAAGNNFIKTSGKELDLNPYLPIVDSQNKSLNPTV